MHSVLSNYNYSLIKTLQLGLFGEVVLVEKGGLYCLKIVRNTVNDGSVGDSVALGSGSVSSNNRGCIKVNGGDNNRGNKRGNNRGSIKDIVGLSESNKVDFVGDEERGGLHLVANGDADSTIRGSSHAGGFMDSGSAVSNDGGIMDSGVSSAANGVSGDSSFVNLLVSEESLVDSCKTAATKDEATTNKSFSEEKDLGLIEVFEKRGRSSIENSRILINETGDEKGVALSKKKSSKSKTKITKTKLAPLEPAPPICFAKREISLLSKLNHKNICNMLDHHYAEEYTIIVLEYCPGGDLYDFIHLSHKSDNYNFDSDCFTKTIHKLVIQISDALNYCHRLGIYHRDIKPENILIDSDLNFKLCDWGLATTKRISNNLNIGTEKYLAPECSIGPYDCMYSDYWSLGVTILTSIYGFTPFKDKKYETKLYDIYPMSDEVNDIFTNVITTKPLERNMNIFVEKLVHIDSFDEDSDVLQDVFEQQFDRDFSIGSKNSIFDTSNSVNSSIESNYIDDKFYKDINKFWESMKNDKIDLSSIDDLKITNWADL